MTQSVTLNILISLSGSRSPWDGGETDGIEYSIKALIRVVMDNLGTHKPASLYEAFPPQEARRILKKLEFHYTPKHGSWLDMAEIELSVFSRKLKQHIPD